MPWTPPDPDRFEDLSRDPDHGYKIRPGTMEEARIGLELEVRGVLPAMIRRPSPEHGERGDFVDGEGQRWDVKSPRSRAWLARKLGRERPSSPIPGEYVLEEFLQDLEAELADGEGVIVNVTYLEPDDEADLRSALIDSGLEPVILYRLT
jgi:hypothetical protein